MIYRVLNQLHSGHILFVLLVFFGALFPEMAVSGLERVTTWFSTSFGWLVLLTCAFFIAFCAYLGMSRYGALKLGKPEESPAYGLFSWLSMLFAAGMGTGLVFYGAAEPLIHYLNPPPMLEPLGPEAQQARRALAVTYFHWGIHAWTIYAVAAMTIAYFTFRHDKPLLPSTPITERPELASVIDSLAIIAVVFGIVGALSQGVLQLSDAVVRVSPASRDYLMLVKLGILAALTLAFVLSATTGIGKGIRILSDTNMFFAIALMLFVLLVGPTQFILNTFVSGIGDYTSGFLQHAFNMRQFADKSSWMGSWTITLFLWWIAWSPFVGVFIARVSRGRTLREFVVGVILAPTGFSLIWFATLGGTALHIEKAQEAGSVFSVVTDHAERATFMLLEQLPYMEFSAALAFFLLFIFLVTSADSGSYVLGMFTRDGNLTPPVSERLFWGAMIGIVAAGSIMTGRGTDFFRSVAIFGALPYLFIMVLQVRGLWRRIKADRDIIDAQLKAGAGRAATP